MEVFSAIEICYAKLANLAPNIRRNEIKFLEIRNDEIKAFPSFCTKIYTNWRLVSSRNHKLRKINNPNTYLRGLEFAIQDEQRTVEFYLEISDETSDAHL